MSTPQRKRLRRVILGAVVLTWLPVLYVLSIGPAYGLLIRRGWAYEALSNVYQPIFRAAEWTDTRQYLRTYLEWWVVNSRL